MGEILVLAPAIGLLKRKRSLLHAQHPSKWTDFDLGRYPELSSGCFCVSACVCVWMQVRV